MTVFLAVLGPSLGLLGVLTGLWVGERRSKREALRDEAKIFKEKLIATYLELWDVVEDVHLKMRESTTEGLTASTFSGLLVDVNNFMIRRGAFIERQDRLLVLEYLFWTSEYLRRLAADPRGQDSLLHSLAHRDLTAELDLLHEVKQRAEELRQQLRDQVRKIAGAPPSEGWSPEVQPSKALLRQLDDLSRRATSELAMPGTVPLSPWSDDDEVIDPK